MLHKKIVLYLVSDISDPNITKCQVYAGHGRRDEKGETEHVLNKVYSHVGVLERLLIFFFFCYDSTKSELAKIKSKAE